MKLRIGGVDYSVIFGREREFVDGHEYQIVVDHFDRQIRLARPFRKLLVQAVSIARKRTPCRKVKTNRTERT